MSIIGCQNFDIPAPGPAAWPAIRPAAWADFRAELLSLYRPPLRAVATHRAMAQTLDELAALGVATTADLTVGLIARFVAGRPAEESPNTTIKHLRQIRAMVNFALRSGRLERSPFQIRPAGSWVRAARPAGKRHLTRAELAALLGRLGAEAAAGRKGWRSWKARRIHAMAAVAAYTGLRRGELYHLHVEDVDLPGRIIHVRPRHTLKTSSSAQPVPMPEALVPILEGWLAARLDPPVFPPASEVPWLWPACRGRGPWTDGPPGHKPLDVLQAVASRAGVEGVTWHALRRSLATHLEGAGVGPAMIARILRHSERVDSEWYRQADAANMRRAVEGFEL
jgi:integrase